jgi:3-mercaptopyruvate sulfurtransferase SseA
VALLLRDNGYRAWALTGGYSAWREAGYPTDSKVAEMARRPEDVCPECNRPWREHAGT